MLSKSGTTRNQFLYDGRDGVVTDNNGLYYMRARYYSTEMKRFVNEDTVLGGIMNGQSLNRFAYVNGNPISYIDPMGRELTATLGFGDYVLGGLGTGLRVVGGVVTTVVDSAVVGSTAAVTVLAVPIAFVISNIDPVQATWDGVGNEGDTIVTSPKDNILEARPGIKKQGREKLEKKRKEDDTWDDRSNNRRPKDPKKHTPGREHRKNFKGLTYFDDNSDSEKECKR